MGENKHLPAILLLCFIASSVSFLSSTAEAQARKSADPTIPTELTPGDPEIRTLLGIDEKSCKVANLNGWTEKLQKAVQMADSRGLVGDRALLEASLASALIVQGEAEQAFLLFQKALQDSIDAK